jgi:hypothetical protein
MKIDDVEIIGGPPVLATQADVDALEAKLWIRFPEGYRDYVTRLGGAVPMALAHQEILVLG